MGRLNFRYKKSSLPILILFLLALLAVNVDSVAAAPEPTPSSDDVNAIAQQLYCPVCENTPLDVCDTEACRQWRDLIYRFLLEGKTEEEIIKYFSVTYGTRVLPTPPAEGFNWLVYIIPPFAFLVGIALLVRSLRIWRKTNGVFKHSPVSEDFVAESTEAPYLTKFEEELKEIIKQK